jgi:hypothetical protein
MIVLSLLLAAAAPAVVAPPHPDRHVAHRRVVRHVMRRKHRVDARLHLVGCGYSATGRCATARSPYRLPLDQPLGPTAKADALAQTGDRCALIGQTICTHPPRTILRVPQ